MSKSDREKAASKTYEQISNVNTDVPNLFENYADPYSVESITGALDKYTNTAVGNVRKGIGTDINRSRSSTASRFAGRGITGGALLEDAIAGGENRVRTAGQDTIEGLLETNLSLRPGVMERGNERAFRNKNADQQTRFAQLNALLQKLGLQSGAAQGLDDTTWFDDVLAVANTVSNFIPFAPGSGPTGRRTGASQATYIGPSGG